ncbi:hypothetical protein OL239_12755 [Arthrobacter sp. ATA002]|uniref:hypothetical protein n=1 Tax=Arthrobacter sp. ATA002 TaxID=2991715 RepID=UPI0022A7B294|nr:hypothetical protein [Arthrobacter sp. ATA002]WAP50852.1 hypothetical protein OL239_12755 [Arthrobacter sp. ATA002]
MESALSRGKHHPPRPKPANSEGMLIANDLKKERGWTDTQIKTFLPEPDQTARNPFSRKAAPMKLYALERVEAIEVTAEYQRARRHPGPGRSPPAPVRWRKRRKPSRQRKHWS